MPFHYKDLQTRWAHTFTPSPRAVLLPCSILHPQPVCPLISTILSAYQRTPPTSKVCPTLVSGLVFPSQLPLPQSERLTRNEPYKHIRIVLLQSSKMLQGMSFERSL